LRIFWKGEEDFWRGYFKHLDQLFKFFVDKVEFSQGCGGKDPGKIFALFWRILPLS